EDSLGLDGIARDVGEPRVVVAVPRLPRIANFDDLEPLAAEPGVAVRLASRPETLADADVVVLPGSKTTVADLAWLRDRRLDGAIASAARDGRIVIGICGGYQMLGERLDDPDHVESDVASARGLGLLPVVTTFARTKTTRRVRGRVLRGGPLDAAAGADVDAYEIHCGETVVHGGAPVFAVGERVGDAPAAAVLAIFLLASPAHALVVRDMLGRDVSLTAPPARIVSLVPSVTETAFALGGEARLVGVSDFCDWPPAARAKPRVGGMINPSLEAIVALKPDLVVGTDEGKRDEAVLQLRRLGIQVYVVHARRVAEMY